MFSKSYCAALQGMCAHIVQIEADVSDGLPVFQLVGYLGSQVKEARERVRIALKNSGYKLPVKKITVNLSPADIRKEGTSYDLSIAVAILSSIGIVESKELHNILFIGELSLDGTIQSVNGVLPIVYEAQKQGFTSCILPKGNEQEGGMVEGIHVFGAESLRQVVKHLSGQEILVEAKTSKWREKEFAKEPLLDFSDVVGQEFVKRAIEIAVAGQHNLLIAGPPGSGKTMLARRIPGIMPDLTFGEAMEISKIYSIAGLLNEERSFITTRPFRAPHHTITTHALVGGGIVPSPGEISLASGGVLFLDELAEYKRNAIESLRQPMEERSITLSRLHLNYSFPSSFMFVGATNLCPCGFYPNRNKCKCSRKQIISYMSKISKALLDRIDIYTESAEIPYEKLKMYPRETSKDVQKRIERARVLQQNRYQGMDIQFNADLTPVMIKEHIILGTQEVEFLKSIYDKMNLTARSYHRLLKVARTIADLGGNERIEISHLQEAVFYRGTENLAEWGE